MIIVTRLFFVTALLLCLSSPSLVWAQETPDFKRHSEVIYGRKHGVALTMDVFAPTQDANGIGVIATVSGGWFSSRNSLRSAEGKLPGFFNLHVRELLSRGYTVFAVVHGSQPKYTVPEILEDMHRAVRYVRHHADEYSVQKDRIGIFGGSAGGHLSLMQGTAGTQGKNHSPDPVERESSRVQAVISYYPPTDFLNYGSKGTYFDPYVRDLYKGKNPFFAALDFHEYNPISQRIELIVGEEEIRKRVANVSPINHVSSDDPPTLIIHGDADKLVPIQQAELIVEKFKAAKVPVKLHVVPGKAHGWKADAAEVKLFADFFDAQLKK